MRCRLHPVVLPVLFAMALAPPAPGQPALEKHRDFLTRIRSPEEMVLPRFPRQYSVPVSLSGAVAEEMRQLLEWCQDFLSTWAIAFVLVTLRRADVRLIH